MRRKKLVFISSNVSPQQVKFCKAMQSYFDARFWFYDGPSEDRAAWWNVELGHHCEILDPVYFRKGIIPRRFVAPRLRSKLASFDPDVVMIGGLSIPSNWTAYRWAKKHSKIVIAFTERSRTPEGRLRGRSLTWSALRWLYRRLDRVVVSADDAVQQFRDEFGFGGTVVSGRYASDLDSHFLHPLRAPKDGGYTYLFANRLTEIYDPLLAIEIFRDVRQRYPESILLMNALGELRGSCEMRLRELSLSDSVIFLDEISSWEDLHEIYAKSDILLLPAKFSNGNFSILEAMASGMGVVISEKVLGVGTLIADGINGFRCAPSRDEFISRIQRYIDCPSILQEHGRLNRGLARPHDMNGTAELFHEIVLAVEKQGDAV